MKSFTANKIEDLATIAENILPDIKAQKNILFYGEMGTGKTTFIKTICKALGCEDEISSPTYAIVNEYQTPSFKFFHFDLYRLNNLDELLDIGFEEYLEQEAICLIEWPQIAEKLIDDFLKIEIHKIDSIQRKFSIFKS